MVPITFMLSERAKRVVKKPGAFPGLSFFRLARLGRHRLHLDPRWIRRGAPDPMGLGFEIALFRLENVRHPGLRIAIDNWKPAALDLHHHLVALLKSIALGVEVHGYVGD